MNYRVDLVVPVYNERETFPALYDFISKNVKSDWRLFVVYDFPEDTTLEVAKPVSDKDPRIKLVLNSERGGLGATKTGFYAAQAEAIMFIMADNSEDMLKKIDEMVQRFYEEKADIVVASRYMRGATRRGGPFLKGVISRLASLSLHWLIGIPTHDATENTRIYRKSMLKEISIESQKTFEVSLEVIIKAHLLEKKIIEVPVIWIDRKNYRGESKFKTWQWLPYYLYWYLYGIKHYWVKKLRRTP
ncbi:MAG: glycosyltransferase [Candidatus Sungbacteria bacterium]|nr:glycosyltransferase [Candidatus Sungbacteria bacterium]